MVSLVFLSLHPYHGIKYVKEVFKLLPNLLSDYLIKKVSNKISQFTSNDASATTLQLKDCMAMDKTLFSFIVQGLSLFKYLILSKYFGLARIIIPV
jgi:hypothetical protein